MRTCLYLLLIYHVLCSFSFFVPSSRLQNTQIQNSPKGNTYTNERKLYGSYLIGLRKTRRLLTNTSNSQTLINIVNFTNNFVINNTNMQDVYINHTEVSSKNIIMGNVVLDVSNIKHIHIKTEKDILILELDKTEKQSTVSSLLGKMNSIDALINTLSLFGKFMNIN